MLQIHGLQSLLSVASAYFCYRIGVKAMVEKVSTSLSRDIIGNVVT
jgi:hypothetical protein